jgi:cGMP-dependent protein kinase 2
LERKPARRIGMLNGRALDIKKHRWFDGFNWAEMEARRNTAPRKPRESDINKRIKELVETERRTAGKVSPLKPEG